MIKFPCAFACSQASWWKEEHPIKGRIDSAGTSPSNWDEPRSKVQKQEQERIMKPTLTLEKSSREVSPQHTRLLPWVSGFHLEPTLLTSRHVCFEEYVRVVWICCSFLARKMTENPCCNHYNLGRISASANFAAKSQHLTHEGSNLKKTPSQMPRAFLHSTYSSPPASCRGRSSLQARALLLGSSSATRGGHGDGFLHVPDSSLVAQAVGAAEPRCGWAPHSTN